MSLTQIRTTINALKRKYALPLAVLRVRLMAEKFCHQWDIARDNHEPIPETHTLITQTAQQSGLPLPTWGHLHRYLDRIRAKNAHPQPQDIVKALIPQAAPRGLLRLLTCELSPALHAQTQP